MRWWSEIASVHNRSAAHKPHSDSSVSDGLLGQQRRGIHTYIPGNLDWSARNPPVRAALRMFWAKPSGTPLLKVRKSGGKKTESPAAVAEDQHKALITLGNNYVQIGPCCG